MSIKIRVVLGVDPGRTGGIALLGVDDPRAAIFEMPEKDDLLPGLLGPLNDRFEIVCVCLEKAQVMPNDGSVSAFSYGKHVGNLEANLHMLGVPVIQVGPKTWQKQVPGLAASAPAPKKPDMSRMSKDEKKVAKKKHQAALSKRRRDLKARSRELAREHYPTVADRFKRVKDDGLADAAHMAGYAKRYVLNGDQ